ncbi:pyruvate dehydrogenase [acetyl-transferring]-phosphatase 1, mitochondrial-like isoform X2 [Hyalella azteca]|uniref:Pyruvate dehydrogenase [acetyl-transferring]-phosphatase 1, mitochondrial-like isoform X2 n=1 Tax=Hyalella azteca TaxID=294128 RepID=A0A979FFT9_HYAAZ|nr:pyruvate dehydrogenase [acetyl-transferring]-phosphatase 1, mitochondrial-like isoform X2 [Hyalella azteca]
MLLANVILRHNEHSIQIGDDPSNVRTTTTEVTPPPLFSISSVDSNQLAANVPIEDKMCAARCLHTTGFLFGVFDGHGGPECSQVVAKRLFEYVAAALLPLPRLNSILKQWSNGEDVQLIQVYHDKSSFVPELAALYQTSLVRWCQQLSVEGGRHAFSMQQALVGAFERLDSDLGEEVQRAHLTSPETQEALIRVAVSGSVACVTHIDGQHVHVASVGDCGALLGRDRDSGQGTGSWSLHKLTTNHDWENPDEVKRVLDEHPRSEAPNIVKNQRLLGALMPFRAFGDFRFKWTQQEQQDILGIKPNRDSFMKFCLTPPYLTAKPDVVYYRLKPYDRFMIIGSDGLWESLSGLDAVTLVGEYMCGRQTLAPVQLPARPITLGEIAQILNQRQEGLRLKPVDTNAATHLIRHSVGASESGLDHGTLAHALTLAPEVRRYFRDDISVHIIFFDQEYLRFCPLDT